jgi:hypothetical protein
VALDQRLAKSQGACACSSAWILGYPVRTDAIMGEVKSPILLIHGTDDKLIAMLSSRRLKSLARSPTALLRCVVQHTMTYTSFLSIPTGRRKG